MLLEAKMRPDDACGFVRGQHVETHNFCAQLLRVPRTLAQQRLRDALPAGARAHVDELDVRAPAGRRLDAGDTERSFAVLREEDTACADVVERVRPFVGPRLRLLERPRHLLLELLPQLAQDGLVGLGRGTDLHGRVNHPVRR